MTILSRPRARMLAAGLVAAGMLQGCGGDSEPSGDASPGTTLSVPATVETSNLSAADTAFIEETVTRAMAGGKIPGVTVSITAPDKTFLRSYGVADKTTGRKLSPADHFRIGSATKTFTATAVLQLVDEKKIELDDTLEAFVPGVPNGATVTIRDLLNMRSGLPSYSDDEFLAAYQADPLMTSWTHTDVVAFLQRTPANFAAGEQFEYSNSNYLLLGMILEKVTGQSAEQAISERVIRKLGLGQTSIPTPATNSTMPEPFTHGYDYDTGQDLTLSNPDVTWTAGNMISTVPDLTRYVKLLADGATLSPQTQQERISTIPIAPSSPAGYGLGIFKFGEWLGHGGTTVGYGNNPYYLPKAQATMEVMVNALTLATPSEAEALRIFGTLADHFYPGSWPQAPSPPSEDGD